VKWPCFYGIDFATRAELIANGLSVEEIRRSIGADSLAYISLDELIAATEVPKPDLCRACFDGIYPVALPDPTVEEHDLLSQVATTSPVHQPDGLAAVLSGVGAADALTRP
jgi:amidophosphoribosyltransferase